MVHKLHDAKILVMNMVGHPKHVIRALNAGVDLICAQGGEGGGHTGSVPTSILIPEVVHLCAGRTSAFISEPIYVIAGGGIYNGRSLAAALMFGANGVWVGTRFVCAREAGAPKAHQDAIIGAGYDSTIRTIIFTGRPLRVLSTPYILDWETNRKRQIQELTSKGVIPINFDLDESEKQAKEQEKNINDRAHQNNGVQSNSNSFDIDDDTRPWLMGKVAGAIHNIKPAKDIIDDMVSEAVNSLSQGRNLIERHANI